MLIHDYPNPPDWNEPLKEAPKCPVCGKEAETFYEKDGEIIGCEYCIKTLSWEEI